MERAKGIEPSYAAWEAQSFRCNRHDFCKTGFQRPLSSLDDSRCCKTSKRRARSAMISARHGRERGADHVNPSPIAPGKIGRRGRLRAGVPNQDERDEDAARQTELRQSRSRHRSSPCPNWLAFFSTRAITFRRGADKGRYQYSRLLWFNLGSSPHPRTASLV